MALLKSIVGSLKSRAAATPLRDRAEIGRLYSKWRVRILYATTGGYAVFYFVRNNLSIAAPAITREFAISNAVWGTMLGLSGLVYGISKFSSGLLADVFNPRFLLPAGLFLSALANIFFGFGRGMGYFTALWMLNSVFSGVGVPPCARLLKHWFAPREIGRAWGVWNASHQIGSAVIVVAAGCLVVHCGWRSAFFVPAAVAIAASFWLHNRLADSPESLGLPAIEDHQAPPGADAGMGGRARGEPGGFWGMIRRRILTNRGVWLVSIANFFVYVVRIGIVNWSPKYLTEAKHLTLGSASVCVLSFEIAGMFGAFVSGWLSDGVFRGRRGPVSAGFMFVLIGLVLALFRVTNGDALTLGLIFAGLGFFVYGPQMLVAVAATDFSTKEAAASAVGLTGLLGYLGVTFCGPATGILVDKFGWNAALWLYAASAAIGFILLATTWNRKASD
jgi:sugar phosphate permease